MRLKLVGLKSPETRGVKLYHSATFVEVLTVGFGCFPQELSQMDAPNPPTGWLPRFNTNRRRFGILFTDTAVGYISLKGIQSVVEGSTEAELLTHFGSLFLWRQIFLLAVFFFGCFFSCCCCVFFCWSFCFVCWSFCCCCCCCCGRRRHFVSFFPCLTADELKIANCDF